MNGPPRPFPVPRAPLTAALPVALLAAVLQTGAGAGAADPPRAARQPLCGLYCLHVGARSVGLRPVLSELAAALGPPGADGYSLAQLAAAAEGQGLHALAVGTTADRLARRPGRFACIAHLDGNHFVLLNGVDGPMVGVVDPPRRYAAPARTLASRWDGRALLISPDPLLPEEALPEPWGWRAACLAAAVLTTAAAAGILYWRRRSGGER